jgi:hypothetical protein
VFWFEEEDDRIDGEESDQMEFDGMGVGWQCICGVLNGEFAETCHDCGRMLGDDG